MTGESNDDMARQLPDREALEAEIDRIRSLGLDELRTLWRTILRSSPPVAFTKDLIARYVCWLIQEQALDGLDPGYHQTSGQPRAGRQAAGGVLLPCKSCARERPISIHGCRQNGGLTTTTVWSMKLRVAVVAAIVAFCAEGARVRYCGLRSWRRVCRPYR